MFPQSAGRYRVLEEEKRYADSLTALQKANTLKKHSSFDLKDEIKTVKTEAKQAKKNPYTVVNFSF